MPPLEITINIAITGPTTPQPNISIPTYQLFLTNAPEKFDGFGTTTLEDHTFGEKVQRFVMIPINHLDWQLSRYSSGMHSAEEIDDPQVAESAVQILWSRLTGKADQ
jgi:hypothetical protein